LFKREEIINQWSARLLEFKAAMLELPKLIAFKFTDPDIKVRVEEEVSARVSEILSRYSRGGIRALGNGDDATNADASKGDNCQPMGGRKQGAKRKGKPPARPVEDEPDAVSQRADERL
jgi:hypothetical protein